MRKLIAFSQSLLFFAALAYMILALVILTAWEILSEICRQKLSAYLG